MKYSNLIRERYSVRKLTSQPVEADKIAAILEAARVAPTARNQQPWRILVLRDANAMEKLKACTERTFGAPMALVVCCRADEAWVRPCDGYNSGVIDTAIVATHIMLAVHNLGLGSTWIGHFNPDPLRRDFNIPQSLEPLAIFPIGYLDPEARPASKHATRRPLEESIIYDRF